MTDICNQDEAPEGRLSEFCALKRAESICWIRIEQNVLNIPYRDDVLLHPRAPCCDRVPQLRLIHLFQDHKGQNSKPQSSPIHIDTFFLRILRDYCITQTSILPLQPNMRNEIPGLRTSSEIHETINLKPAGEVVIEVATTITESKDEEGGVEEAKRRGRGGTNERRGDSIKVNSFTLSAPCFRLYRRHLKEV